MLRAKTSKAHINGKGDKCRLHPPPSLIADR